MKLLRTGASGSIGASLIKGQRASATRWPLLGQTHQPCRVSASSTERIFWHSVAESPPAATRGSVSNWHGRSAMCAASAMAAGTRLSGDYDRARDLYLESVALGDELGDERRKQQEFHNLGWVELHRGDIDAAERMFAERGARSGLDAMGDAWTDLNRAAVALARGQRALATELFRTGKHRLDELGAALDPDDQFEFDWLAGRLDA